ncbi:zinc finger SWIM domain protein [Isosphaera pallida ATCC 43644]|uniref:Zinc finger SWIM domain protein n=1 Tax=Isosphaera pallida (strain ATCC 43644 / DSM 9630 / IS1B) TaxID=575540 RepID=E8R315_ISOPI|nr:SWIM zinc finger family protein [Isosphaera pallida]ADV61519.1 zinc finger SWIM domain protein [Isosphaera pallida ATCC 43644]
MITIDEAFVNSSAPNPDTSQNGRSLVLKGQFVTLNITEDRTLIFGECKGSGKTPYQCSCDFIRPDQPTYRCSCPSRQFPCKHCVGLMFAYVMKQPFTIAEPPAALQEKRAKLQEKAQRKETEPAKPKKVNKAALVKKIEAQLDGIDLLEQITRDLIRLGVGNLTSQQASEIKTQAARLGDAYLPGARGALLSYLGLFTDDHGQVGDLPPARAEAIQSEALEHLARLHALVKQGRAYLKQRLDDPNLSLPTDSAIAAWLGHAWQLAELREAGLVETDVELVQLAFRAQDDPARQEFIDSGVWMSLGDGKIRVTQTIRPYKAARYIKSEDSFFQVACVKELCVYPGGVNPRIRWDGMTPRPLQSDDLATIRRHAREDFATLIKEVKASLKSPLADRTPIHALRFARLGKVGGQVVAEDAQGQRLILSDAGIDDDPPSCHLLPLLPPACLADQVMIARFRHDLDARTLRIKPLSIVTPETILRLTF